jgi:hypothetical protein
MASGNRMRAEAGTLLDAGDAWEKRERGYDHGGKL